MLSPSHPKIHEPPVTGVSPRPMDQRQRQKTAKHERACGCPKLHAQPVTCLFVHGTWPGMIR
jgi:hypothetical protein